MFSKLEERTYFGYSSWSIGAYFAIMKKKEK